MAGKPVDPWRWDQFARLVAKGMSKREAASKAGISYSSVMRQKGEVASEMNVQLADKGVTTVPNYDSLCDEAKRALEDFGYFRARYFARSTSPWAEEAAYKVVKLLQSPEKEYLVVNVAPGVGKSSFFTHDLPAWLTVRNRAIRQMIGSSTQRLASGYTGNLRDTFERIVPQKAYPELLARRMAQDAESTLVKDFGRFKPTSAGLWRREEFTVEQHDKVVSQDKESSFVAFGMDTKFLGGRFDNVVWDDLVTSDTVRTDFARENLIRLWETEAEARLEPGGLLILQGQRIASNDLYRYALDLLDVTEMEMDEEDDVEGDKAKKYHHIVFKAHYEDKCEALIVDGKTTRPGHKKTADPYPKGCLLDPYRLTFKDLMRVQKNRDDRYQLTYQQEDVDIASSLVQKAWIDGTPDSEGYIGRGCWDEDRVIGRVSPMMKGYSVIMADPSPSKYWAIYWAIFNPDTKEYHILDLHRAQMDAPDFLDWNQMEQRFTGLLEEWRQRAEEQHRPITHLIVEANAGDRYLLQYDHFRRWMSRYAIRVTPHQTFKNKSDENYGVQTLAPIFKFGQVRLPGEKLFGSRTVMNQLVKEVTQWPHGTTDDTVMALWFLRWNAPRLFPPVRMTPIQMEVPSWV
jgi:hypothetical protein